MPKPEPESPKEADVPVAKSSLVKKLAIVGVCGALMVVGYLYAFREPDVTQEKMVETALELLLDPQDANGQQDARRIAEQLKEENYRDYNSPWAIDYILGILAFRDAEFDSQYGETLLYAKAERLLAEAIADGLDEGYSSEFAYAMGTILFRIGSTERARDWLLQAVERHPSKRVESLSMLTESYAMIKESESLEVALQYSAQLLQTDGLEPEVRDRAYIQRASVLLGLGRKIEADEVLSKVSSGEDSHATRLFRAMALMDENQFEEAKKLLRLIENAEGLERAFSQQAAFQLGVCEEKLGHVDEAIQHYQKTARNYLGSEEAVAADLRAADMLRRLGRDEQALQSYNRALRTVRSPTMFRNRWVNAEEFRALVHTAWEEWLNKQYFDESIQLTSMMSPLFTLAQSTELAARSKERWAEQLDKQYLASTHSRRLQLKPALSEHWQMSAIEYARLADEIIISPRYSDVLWVSADHFRKAHDFENALLQINRFIDAQPENRMAQALVRRGEIQMDLGSDPNRLKQAIRDFETVIESNPTDPAAFQAEYLIGQCQLELDDVPKAEQAWRSLIESPLLKPAALEWRLSLFSLGRLLCHSAETLKHQADNLRIEAGGEQREEIARLETQAYARWDEAISYLDAYLRRYDDSAEEVEARFLLAQSLQYSARQAIEKLKTAETENARNELRNTINETLNLSAREYIVLREELRPLALEDRLDVYKQQVLRDCYFEVAHISYRIGQYDEAIRAYSQAVTHYPQNPQVLLAYLQMTECYDHLNKPVEARSMIEQAKLIHKNMDDAYFQSEMTNLSKDEWGRWIERARRLRMGDSLPRDVVRQ